MLQFLSQNLANILIGALVIAAVVFAVIKIRKDKKKSPCGSCCGCAKADKCGKSAF